MLTKQFWRGAAERAIKTFLQAFASVITLTVGAETIGATAHLGSLNWLDAVSIAAFATFYSFLTSVGNAEFTAGDDLHG